MTQMVHPMNPMANHMNPMANPAMMVLNNIMAASMMSMMPQAGMHPASLMSTMPPASTMASSSSTTMPMASASSGTMPSARGTVMTANPWMATPPDMTCHRQFYPPPEDDDSGTDVVEEEEALGQTESSDFENITPKAVAKHKKKKVIQLVPRSLPKKKRDATHPVAIKQEAADDEGDDDEDAGGAAPVRPWHSPPQPPPQQHKVKNLQICTVGYQSFGFPWKTWHQKKCKGWNSIERAIQRYHADFHADVIMDCSHFNDYGPEAKAGGGHIGYNPAIVAGIMGQQKALIAWLLDFRRRLQRCEGAATVLLMCPRGTKRSVALGLIVEHILSTIPPSIALRKPWHISLKSWCTHMELCRSCNDLASPQMTNSLSDAILIWDNL